MGKFPLGTLGTQLCLLGSFHQLLREASSQLGLGKFSNTAQTLMLLSGVAGTVEGGGTWRDPPYVQAKPKQVGEVGD